MSGKGIEWFEDIARKIEMPVICIAQIPRLRNCFIYTGKMRKQNFRNSEVPVRMPGPLDIKIFPDVETNLNILADDLVGDRSVIDALDADELFVVIGMKKLIALRDDRANIDNRNAKMFLG